ncbi:MAG: HNH endonuclease signature motif containing protein [Campylobacterota bacterium]|nr:HNH endonuclease signature motif containing protein [Campylobacterota bacterium]
MYFLGLDFIISSLIWLIVIVAFVFTFRKVIFKRFYKHETLDIFLGKLKGYLKKTYPDITFNFSIIKESLEEPNPNLRKYIIADDIINQFYSLKLDKIKFPKSTPQKLHWSSYIFNSEPNKNKLPSDLSKRVNALLLRDNKKCFRCSKHIDMYTANIYMIRKLEDGGKYYLENLLPLCKDCDKILNNKSTTLNIKDELYDIIEDS